MAHFIVKIDTKNHWNDRFHIIIIIIIIKKIHKRLFFFKFDRYQIHDCFTNGELSFIKYPFGHLAINNERAIKQRVRLGNLIR